MFSVMKAEEEILEKEKNWDKTVLAALMSIRMGNVKSDQGRLACLGVNM